MFHLTRQERKVLLLIAVLIASGAALRFSGLAAKVTQPLAENEDRKILVNINTAGLTELTAIPGVGPVTAQRIIDYRAGFGYFNNIEDLVKVKGIGPKKIQAMKEYVTF